MRNTQRAGTIAILVFLLAPPVLFSKPGDVTLFPDSSVFPRLPAEGLAHGVSLTNIVDTREWIAALGWEMPVLEIGRGTPAVQIGLGATAFSGLLKTAGHLSVQTVDYRVDMPVDVRFNRCVFRTGVGHISSHLVDDAIEQEGRQSIQYVKDYLFLFGATGVPWTRGYVYAGTFFRYHSLPGPDNRWAVQLGGQLVSFPISSDVSGYVAVDVTLAQENSWGSRQRYEAGIRLDPGGSVKVRFALAHARGFDDRGQFFDRKRIDTMVLFRVER